MLHLRARLQRLQALEPEVKALAAEMAGLLDNLKSWREQPVGDADSQSVVRVLEQLGNLKALVAVVGTVSDAYERFMQLQDAIEARHTRLIKLAQVRADTRVKNKAAEQLDVFVVMLERLMTVLQESLMPTDFLALQRRLVRELAEVPQRALEPHTAETKEKKLN